MRNQYLPYHKDRGWTFDDNSDDDDVDDVDDDDAYLGSLGHLVHLQKADDNSRVYLGLRWVIALGQCKLCINICQISGDDAECCGRG